MASSKAATVKQYLAELPPERRKTISAVRDVIVKSLPGGYVETMNWGMICYEVPLDTYPNTYNKQPLCLSAIAAQKNYNSLYVTCAYMNKPAENRLRMAFKQAGLKLDMGKSCIRFQKPGDLPLEAIGKMIAETGVDEFIRQYEKARSRS